MSGSVSAPLVNATAGARVPYVFIGGSLNPGLTGAQVDAAHQASTQNYPDVATAFRETVCDGIDVSRFVAGNRTNNALLETSDLLGRKKFKAAAKTLFAFSKAAWQREVFRMAEKTALFAAALGADLATYRSLDLGTAKTREAIFGQLTRAGMTEELPTQKYPAALGLGSSWALFSQRLGGSTEASFAQLLVGAGLVLKTFSYRTQEQNTYESLVFTVIPPNAALRAMLDAEVNGLRAMQEKGIPIVETHHVDTDNNAYVREYVRGGVFNALEDPLMGIDHDEQLQAGRKWYERAQQIRQAGFWTNATLTQMRGSMVYSIADHAWKVFGTLPEAHV